MDVCGRMWRRPRAAVGQNSLDEHSATGSIRRRCFPSDSPFQKLNFVGMISFRCPIQDPNHQTRCNVRTEPWLWSSGARTNRAASTVVSSPISISVWFSGPHASSGLYEKLAYPSRENKCDDKMVCRQELSIRLPSVVYVPYSQSARGVGGIVSLC